ncbi:MAG: tryptophan-rich sensory protein [Methanocellales archaeon]|nr:tryptophan-rich sensory protein [Methanocellales archaeon]MDD3292351.1 tryptophan-rich sensory protein [Methanocellales archaeon]MDD5235609.1 tryptophan-rich sensory protein [Methanocellales archaeon]MDD5485744.1 tryptophan-rich sensory protein [Methanocellales archaeon]
MKINNIPSLVYSILICQLAGIIGSFFTFPSIPTWYAALEKPSFSPPNWLFSPVWIALFLLMGVSLYLVWISGAKTRYVKMALTLFGIQLALNVLWSIIFFGLKSPFYAFIEMAILWVAILLTIFQFFKISKTAAYLLIPYILWVSFAAVLNFSIWIINL